MFQSSSSSKAEKGEGGGWDEIGWDGVVAGQAGGRRGEWNRERVKKEKEKNLITRFCFPRRGEARNDDNALKIIHPGELIKLIYTHVLNINSPGTVGNI